MGRTTVVLVTVLVALGIAVLPVLAGPPTDSAPTGWFLAGSQPRDYTTTTDTTIKHEGKSSGCLACTTTTPAGFGTLMQQFKADEYRGKRLRLTAFVRTESIEKTAGVWMRIDGPAGKTLGFDNMNDRLIRGSTDWTRYGIVLDVPQGATGIAFGILIEGMGKAWIDDLKFDVVDKNTPTTGSMAEPEDPYQNSPMQPANLDFETAAQQEKSTT